MLYHLEWHNSTHGSLEGHVCMSFKQEQLMGLAQDVTKQDATATNLSCLCKYHRESSYKICKYSALCKPLVQFLVNLTEDLVICETGCH